MEVAEIVMQDDNEDVQQSIGAMLVEATRLQAPRVVEFLEAWKDRSPRLILEVGSTKLPASAAPEHPRLMATGASANSPRRLTLGRRLYRGFAFAVIVGLASAALSAVPALFIQSIFVAEAQRCIEAIEMAAGGGDVELRCIDEFTDPPVWMPLAVVCRGRGDRRGWRHGVRPDAPATATAERHGRVHVASVLMPHG